MADPIIATSVTYAVQGKGSTKSGTKFVVKLTFGNATLEYRTATGVPLTAGMLGCPNHIVSLDILENSVTSGYKWDYDNSASKLKGFYADYNAVADSGLIEIANTTAIAAQEVWVEVEGY